MEALPVINISELSPSEHIYKMNVGEKTEILNMTSIDLADRMIESIMEGRTDPLEFAVKRKLIVDALDYVMKDDPVKAYMLEEVKKHNGKASVLGDKISTTSRPTYHYKADATWLAIKGEMAPLEAKLKAQEELIKIACKNNVSLMGEGGEVLAAVVPSPASESISVSFSKK